MIQVQHYDQPFTPSTIEYSITHRVITSDSIRLDQSSLPTIPLHPYNDDQWIQIAQPFHMYSIPTRILIERKVVPKKSKGNAIYDVIISRSNSPYDWTVNHVLYEEEEESPFSLFSRKRTYDQMLM
jgi:hypothetical protein